LTTTIWKELNKFDKKVINPKQTLKTWDFQGTKLPVDGSNVF